MDVIVIAAIIAIFIGVAVAYVAHRREKRAVVDLRRQESLAQYRAASVPKALKR